MNNIEISKPKRKYIRKKPLQNSVTEKTLLKSKQSSNHKIMKEKQKSRIFESSVESDINESFSKTKLFHNKNTTAKSKLLLKSDYDSTCTSDDETLKKQSNFINYNFKYL